jgi:hypothetical protein
VKLAAAFGIELLRDRIFVEHRENLSGIPAAALTPVNRIVAPPTEAMGRIATPQRIHIRLNRVSSAPVAKTTAA